MKLFYRGKNAIVTGASGGMGLEISKMLSENNINVLMLDVKSPGKTFLNENENCTFAKVDATNFKKFKSIIEKFYKKNKTIDYLVNTIGVLWFNKDVSAADIKPDIWDKIFEINLKTCHNHIFIHFEQFYQKIYPDFETFASQNCIKNT